MVLNYLILVHKNPDQLKRLIDALRTKDTIFYLHVDRKCEIASFKSIVPESTEVYYVTDDNRIDVRWGSISVIEAVFAMMRMVVSQKSEGHCVLLSGQDYPIRSNQYIASYLNNHTEFNFMSIYPIPDIKKASENGGRERFLMWTFDCYNPHDARMKAKIRPYSFGLKTLGGFFRLFCYRRDLLPKAIRCWFKKRIYPSGLQKSFNELWCVLSYNAVRKLLQVYDSRTDIQCYFKNFHIPDETLFSAILSMDANFSRKLLPMCHYINWNVHNGGSPKTLDESDIPNMMQAIEMKPYLLFARKFDYQVDLFDRIDKELRNL